MEWKINKSIYTLTAPKYNQKLSNCFILELYNLKELGPIVVGWTVLPMINGYVELIEGKFKLPLLKGKKDESIYSYELFEYYFTASIENWLGNIYIEVKHSAIDIEASDEIVKTNVK